MGVSRSFSAQTVGRVGALAIALGVGGVIVALPGLAAADTDGAVRGDAARPQRHRLYLGTLAAIALAVSLVVVQWVVLKMLPFDNKSEFQVVLDMPEGTPVETTARVLDELAAEVARRPEVTDYQVYAGTSAPINFNGLVRQYYLRSGPEVGDIQVNLVDKHHRKRLNPPRPATIGPSRRTKPPDHPSGPSPLLAVSLFAVRSIHHNCAGLRGEGRNK